MAKYEFPDADVDAAVDQWWLDPGWRMFELESNRVSMQRVLNAGTATLRAERADMLICLRNLVSAVYHDDVDRAKAEARAIITKVKGSNPPPPLERDVQQDEGTF